MLTTVRKLTKKGQVTVPKKIREQLKSDAVEFEILDGNVIIKPVKSVAGALRKYAKALIPFEESREKAWEEVARGRAKKRTGRR
jgi:AbrB family looped-hinge helix DNA binding protein